MLATLYQFVETHLYDFLEFYGPWLMISIGTIVFLVEAIGGVRAEYGECLSVTLNLQSLLTEIGLLARSIQQEEHGLLGTCCLVSSRISRFPRSVRTLALPRSKHI